MEKVKCVKIGGKLRMVSTNPNKEGFIQFPKDLRVEGKVFEVGKLVWKGAYWAAEGNIRPYRRPASKKKKVIVPIVKTWKGIVEYNSEFDYEYLRYVVDILKNYKCSIKQNTVDWMDRFMEFTFRATADNKKLMFKNLRECFNDEARYARANENKKAPNIRLYSIEQDGLEVPIK